jgi:hypothetical protein
VNTGGLQASPKTAGVHVGVPSLTTKMFHNLVTSLPRSVDGYIANYSYALLAYVLR